MIAVVVTAIIAAGGAIWVLVGALSATVHDLRILQHHCRVLEDRLLWVEHHLRPPTYAETRDPRRPVDQWQVIQGGKRD